MLHVLPSFSQTTALSPTCPPDTKDWIYLFWMQSGWQTGDILFGFIPEISCLVVSLFLSLIVRKQGIHKIMKDNTAKQRHRLKFWVFYYFGASHVSGWSWFVSFSLCFPISVCLLFGIKPRLMKGRQSHCWRWSVSWSAHGAATCVRLSAASANLYSSHPSVSRDALSWVAASLIRHLHLYSSHLSSIRPPVISIVAGDPAPPLSHHPSKRTSKL